MANRNQADTATQLVQELLTAPKAGDIEYIYCRRNFPYVLKSPQFDPMWEIPKLAYKGGKKVYEIDPHGSLKINIDGTCRIWKTENNVKRLDRIMKNTTYTRNVKKFDQVTMKRVDHVEIVTILPEYERLEKSIIEEDTIKRIAEAVSALQNAPKVDLLDDESDDKTPERGTNVIKQRGRPKKLIPVAAE